MDNEMLKIQLSYYEKCKMLDRRIAELELESKSKDRIINKTIKEKHAAVHGLKRIQNTFDEKDRQIRILEKENIDLRNQLKSHEGRIEERKMIKKAKIINNECKAEYKVLSEKYIQLMMDYNKLAEKYGLPIRTK